MDTVLRRGIPVMVLVSLLLVARTDVQAHGGDASLVHGCVNKNSGRARIVGANDECLPSESAVHWSGGGASSSQTFFEVYDAMGAMVGPVVGLNGLDPMVGFKVGEARFVLFMAQGFLAGSQPVYFQTPDCSPPGYLGPGWATLPSAGLGPVGQTLMRQIYIEDPTAQSVTFRPASAAIAGWCFQWGGSVTAAPALPVLQIGPPPYTVR